MFIPITKNIFMVEAPNKAKIPYCHCLFIKDEVNALIDTGCGLDDVAILNKEKIDIIVNSHFHEDHILQNTLFHNPEILVHKLDAPGVRSLDTFLEYYGFHKYDALDIGRDFINSINLKPSRVDREFEGGEILDFGKVKLHIIHTPGHTPGHCCFYEEKTGLLFLGDIDLSTFGPWYGHDCSNLDDFITSINKCIEIDPAIAVSCHKGIFRENIKERLKKYLDTIYIKEEMVIKTLSTPLTLEEIVDKQIFYGTRITLDPFFRVMEKMAILNHLKRLIKRGLVKYNDNYYYLK